MNCRGKVLVKYSPFLHSEAERGRVYQLYLGKAVYLFFMLEIEEDFPHTEVMKNKVFGQRMIGITMFHLKKKSDFGEISKEIKKFIAHRLHEHGAQLVCLGMNEKKRKIFIQSFWEGEDRKERALAFNSLPEIVEARKAIDKYCKKVKDYHYDQILE